MAARILDMVASNLKGIVQFTDKGNAYGTLHIRGEDSSPYPLFMTVFYGTEPESRTRSYRLAPEKADRLAGRPTDIASFQSRNPEREMYGGAIRIPPGKGIGYLSWSGFSEEEDEAFMLCIAVRAGLMDPSHGQMIATATENKKFDALLPQVMPIR